MNNENVVVNRLVTERPILPSDIPREDFSRNYQHINFFNLAWGLSHEPGDICYDNSFLHPKKGIMFRDYVGRQLMTGNELLYYPELAKKVREIENYPILECSYKVDETIEGLAFLDYFNHRVKACRKAFEESLNSASLQIDQLIEDYGQKRFTPIINNETYEKYQPLMIHGVEWSVDCFARFNPSRCIDLYRLFNISKKVICARIEEIMTGTPFVAVRMIKKWGYKGYVEWYSLDTQQIVSKREMARWKKLH